MPQRYDILDWVPTGICVLRPDTTVSFWNRTLEEWTGIPRAELLGRPARERFPHLDEPRYRHRLEQVFRLGTPTLFSAQLHKRLFPCAPVQGRERVQNTTITGVAVEGGFDALVVVQDVTELSLRIQEYRALRDRALQEVEQRTAAQRELARERERAQVTLGSIGDAVISVSLDGAVDYLNPTAERLLGRSSAECLGRPVDQVYRVVDGQTRVPQESSARLALASNALVRPGRRGLLRSTSGAEVPLDECAAPIRGPDGAVQGAVLVFRDVSEERRREEERLRAQKLESLAVLAGGIAHDFNNLLTGITTNVSLSLDAPLDPSLREMLGDVAGAADRAKGLAQQLLTFAKGGEPVRRVVELGAVVRAAAEGAPKGLPAGCAVEIAADLWPAEVDAGQIGEVVRGLVLNGAEAMPAGGTVRVRLANQQLAAGDKSGLPPGPYARLEVRDTGVGIPPELIDRVREPYFSTKPGSSGLGLAVCHSIVSRHGGRLALASSPGAGTTAVVLLPARPGAVPARPAPALPAPPGAAVLLMDDEETIRRSTARLLASLGYRAVAVADGAAAVEQVRRGEVQGDRFAAVILDLTIPGGMGGAEAAARIRSISPATRMIVSSGYSNDPVMAAFRRHGFSAVLPKPYSAAELRAALAEATSAGPAEGRDGAAPTPGR